MKVMEIEIEPVFSGLMGHAAQWFVWGRWGQGRERIIGRFFTAEAAVRFRAGVWGFEI